MRRQKSPPGLFFVLPLGQTILTVSMVIMSLASAVGITSAQTADELRQKIDQKNSEIETLEKEIVQYEQQISATGKQAQTLQGAINRLTLTQKKLSADVALTQKKIDATVLTIESLGGQITDKETSIEYIKDGLASVLRNQREADDTSLAEIVLQNFTLSTFSQESTRREKIAGTIVNTIGDLTVAKTDLAGRRDDTQTEKNKLEKFRAQLNDQQRLVAANKKEQDTLLKETKNKESNYKALLADRKAKRDAFAQELLDIESQLKILIDPSKLPTAGTTALQWPVDTVRITQYFGNTDFSRANPGVYNGQGHNGIDLGVPEGTPIKAAAAGSVVSTGNTDTVCSGASYGKWVLIRHNNGLSTLYAHLSLISVSQGQQVSTRQLIGYSGSTGYATGPHLHFTVYATEGVQVLSRKSRVCGGTYVMPIADLKAYLNPLSYLPQ